MREEQARQQLTLFCNMSTRETTVAQQPSPHGLGRGSTKTRRKS
jgi:hypothetical protein